MDFALKKRFLILVIGIIAVLFSNSAYSSVERMDIQELIEFGDLIFAGTVENIESAWNDGMTTIYTYVEFNDLKIIKGDIKDSTITLRFRGGRVGNDMIISEDIPNFRLGGRYILISYTPFSMVLSDVVGLFQGLFQIAIDKESNRKVVVDYHKNFVTGLKDSELIFIRKGRDVQLIETSIIPRVRPDRSRAKYQENLRVSLKNKLIIRRKGPSLFLSPNQDTGKRFSEDEFLELLKTVSEGVKE